jgi:hypothetical protein
MRSPLVVAFIAWIALLEVSPAYSFEPTMSIRVETPSRPIIYGTTTLPDGAKLLVTLSRPESKYMAQDDVVVRSGQFRTSSFTQRGQPFNPGTYGVVVSMSLAELQSPEVRAVIGSKGEKMTGPLVKRGSLGPTFQYVSTFAVGKAADPQLDAKERQRTEEDLKKWIIKSCNDTVDLVNRMVRNGAVSGREIVGVEREKRVAHCIKELSG